MTDSDNVTELLSLLHAGDGDVVSQLLPMIRDELRRIANIYFSRDWAAHNFDPSDLVQEASLRLLIPGKGPWNDREHFFAIAALNIHQRLVDHGRKLRAERRGGGKWKRVELDDALPAEPEHWSELLDVDEALRRLEALNERQSRVVKYRFFGGMTIEETATALGVCPNTVKTDWAVAAAFLRRELIAYSDARAVGSN
ncbi:MAG: sigma-70 family RNA polymerase sigma factor [Acidobacteriia bacterium]|nr:sigma-70 family RNA polymerase sigma factor [Terriglobia bacterium]